MEYEHSDASGTDDDLPPSQPGRISRGGRVTGNERAMSGGGHYGRASQDHHLCKLEQDAYVAVLRAFTAQSEVITWRKENLMVTLRQHLNISDQQHLEILKGMDSHGAPSQYRDRRSQEDDYGGSMYARNMDMGPAAARKKAKASLGQPEDLLPAKWAPSAGGPSKSKKSKGGRNPKLENVPTGINPRIGRRVKLRWPADNVFYDALVTDYDAAKGLHALVYDINTQAETLEWVDLKELPSNDLQFIDGPLVDVTGKKPSTNFGAGGRGMAGRGGPKKGVSRNNLMAYGRGRISSKVPSSSFERPTPSMPGRNNCVDMKLLKLPSLDALVKQVDRIAEEDDLAKIESVKRQAKEHEEMLRKALAEVCESSEEGESEDEENVLFSHAHSLDRERGRRSRPDSRDQHGYHNEQGTAGDRDQGSDGQPIVGGGHHGGGASDADNDDHHDGDDG